MATDMKKVLQAALDAAFEEPLNGNGRHPSRKPRMTAGKAVLLGAGIVTAGRLLAGSRGQGILEWLEEQVGEDDADDPDASADDADAGEVDAPDTGEVDAPDTDEVDAQGAGAGQPAGDADAGDDDEADDDESAKKPARPAKRASATRAAKSTPAKRTAKSTPAKRTAKSTPAKRTAKAAPARRTAKSGGGR